MQAAISRTCTAATAAPYTACSRSESDARSSSTLLTSAAAAAAASSARAPPGLRLTGSALSSVSSSPSAVSAGGRGGARTPVPRK